MRNSTEINQRMALCGLLLAGGALAWHGVAQAHYVNYSGRATVLRVQVGLLTSTTKVVLADTGEIDPTGTTRDATVVTFDNPAPLEVHSKTAHAIAAGSGGTSASTAAVEKLVVKLPGLSITADVIESNASAACNRETQTVKTEGSSQIVNLVINGHKIATPSRPNTKIAIPGVATVILDERSNPNVNSQVVTAIHVIVPGLAGVAGADVQVSRAESGILKCPAVGAP